MRIKETLNKALEFYFKLFRKVKCNEDHFFHDWKYEDQVETKMVGTGQYIEGKEIEQKETFRYTERHCTRCRKNSAQDPFGFWWPSFMPYLYEGEYISDITSNEKGGHTFHIDKKWVNPIKLRQLEEGEVFATTKEKYVYLKFLGNDKHLIKSLDNPGEKIEASGNNVVGTKYKKRN